MMHSPYLLIPLFLFSLVGYLLSVWLVRISVLSKSLHRKIWNTILLISFLISGILGIMLVIQVNYKLEWTFMKPLMKWHVDTGILMCLVTTFHVLWHSSYFKQLFSKMDTGSHHSFIQLPADNNLRENPTMWMWVLGFFAMIVQVLLIREISAIFQGNEVLLGWTLGIWMFLTGMGSWFGRSFLQKDLRLLFYRILLYLTWMPIVVVLLMNVARNLLFSPGEATSPLWFLTIITLMMAPVCIPSGFLFSLLVRTQSRENRGFTKVYVLEALGSLLGGIMVSLILIRFLSVIQSLMIASVIIHVILLSRQINRKVVLSAIILLIFAFSFLLSDGDRKIKSLIFENQKVLATHETVAGNVTVCENGGEKTFYENGIPLFSTGDIVINEEYIHYALLQHDHPRDVLLVSGEVAGLTGEILKYPDISSVDYIGLNPGLTKMTKRYLSFPEDKRITILNTDGRRYLFRTEKKYDITIIAVPDPSSLQMNRYYSEEFIQILKSRLNPGAVVLFGISPSGNYITQEKIRLEAAVYHTLNRHFRNLVIIPGEKDYFVASDNPVSYRIGELSEKRKIRGNYINADYIDEASILSRGAYIRENLDRYSEVNSDKKPFPVFYHSLQYLSRFEGMKSLVTWLPLLFVLIPLILMSPVTTGMFVTGFTASAAEIMLIFWFQVVLGNVYAAIGLIFALFMGGLAAGSVSGSRMVIRRWHYVFAQLWLVAYMLVVPFSWSQIIISMADFPIWIIFMAMLLIPAFLTGFQFVSYTLQYHPDMSKSAASVYAADLWGSALGAFIVSMLLVPLAGINGSCLIIAALNIMVLLKFLVFGNKS